MTFVKRSTSLNFCELRFREHLTKYTTIVFSEHFITGIHGDDSSGHLLTSKHRDHFL